LRKNLEKRAFLIEISFIAPLKFYLMTYLGVSDLKQTRRLWEILGREKEVLLTRDGKPAALIVEITPDGVEATVAAVRRALFSEAVSSARERAADAPPTAPR